MEETVINKNYIEAMLYLPEYNYINTSYLDGYMSDLDLRDMIIDMNMLISRCNLSENEHFIVSSLKKETTQKEIADRLNISQSAISQKIDSIINKIYKIAN